MEPKDLNSFLRGKNINFLIGSGASVPIYSTLSLGKSNFSFEDIVSDKKLSDHGKKLMYLYYYCEIIKPMESMKELARIDTDFDEADNSGMGAKNRTLANYYNFVDFLNSFLQTESNERPKRINIFTTNYDLIFEYTFDKYIKNNPLIYFNDGARGIFKRYIDSKNFNLNITHSGYNDFYSNEIPTINLFKLHGSLSWKLDDGKISAILPNQSLIDIVESENRCTNYLLEKVKEEILLLTPDTIDKDCFIEVLNELVDKISVRYRKFLDKFYDSYQKLTIINPDKYKFEETVLAQHYYQLLRSFSYELEKKQSVLIVLGFSFADEHIKSILERSLLNPELQVFIIIYRFDSQDKLKEKFGNYHNITYFPNSQGINGNFSYLLSLLRKSYE